MRKTMNLPSAIRNLRNVSVALFVLVGTLLAAWFLLDLGQQASGVDSGNARVLLYQTDADPLEEGVAEEVGISIVRSGGDLAVAIGDETRAILVTRDTVDDVPPSLLRDSYAKGIVVGGIDVARDELAAIVGRQPERAPPIDWTSAGGGGYPHQFTLVRQVQCPDGNGSSGITVLPMNDVHDLSSMIERYIDWNSCSSLVGFRGFDYLRG